MVDKGLIGRKFDGSSNKEKDSKTGEPKVQECGPNDQPAREGMKAYKVLGSRFELPENYEIIEPVGSGAYGVVIAVKDKSGDESNNLVAIKKIEKAFEHKVFAMRTLRELKIMRLLDHDNILSIQSILMPESLENFD